MPKLKEEARRFAAICEAPLAAVPTLDEYLAGRNIPAAKTQIKTQPSPAARPLAAKYISAYPVVDALNFSAAMARVGDRVELIGRIVEVTPGSRKVGKGPPKNYVFINFGSSRGNIVKISIWSDGLAKLKEQPSEAWIGRWVSVTGLIDVPYENKRYGHKHLSITVQEDGQIQELNETEAGFATCKHPGGFAASRSRGDASRCIREPSSHNAGCRRGEAEAEEFPVARLEQRQACWSAKARSRRDAGSRRDARCRRDAGCRRNHSSASGPIVMAPVGRDSTVDMGRRSRRCSHHVAGVWDLYVHPPGEPWAQAMGQCRHSSGAGCDGRGSVGHAGSRRHDWVHCAFARRATADKSFDASCKLSSAVTRFSRRGRAALRPTPACSPNNRSAP